MRLASVVSPSIHTDMWLLDQGIGVGDAAFFEQPSRRREAFTE